MIAALPAHCCIDCGAARTHHERGRCWACHVARLDARPLALIECQNCEVVTVNRGRGLCGRCYQALWRTGTLPAPNLTTPEEVLDG